MGENRMDRRLVRRLERMDTRMARPLTRAQTQIRQRRRVFNGVQGFLEHVDDDRA